MFLIDLKKSSLTPKPDMKQQNISKMKQRQNTFPEGLIDI